MVILELAIQGVKGLAPSVRLAFKQGYTLLQPQQPGGSLWKLFEALFYADGRVDTSSLVAPGAPIARAGLTFQGRDGTTYRLVRELGGAGTLARMDAGTGKFVPITQDAAEIAQYLRSTCGLPTRGAYEHAFSITPAGWPSKQAAPAGGVPKISAAFPALQSSSAQLMSASARTVQPATDVNAAKAMLVQLKKELDGTKEIDELQFKLDGAQKRVFDLDGKVRKLDELRKQLDQARATAEAAPSPVKMGLPENIAESAARMEGLEKQRDDQLRRLEREREQFLGKNFNVEPLYKDQAFGASMGIGLLTLIIGVALGHAWRYLSLLDIPSFGMAAVLAIRWIGDVQGSESAGRRKSHYNDREKQIQDNFENEVLSVKTAMKLLGVESPGQLIETFAQRQLLERQMQDAAAQLSELESDPSVAEAQREMNEVQLEQGKIEARLSELSGYGRPSHAVEAEIEEVEASIQAALNPQARAAPTPTPAEATRPPTGQTPAIQPPAEDPVPKLLDATADLFGADVATMGPLIAPRAAQYLAALTERRLGAVEIDAKGRAQVATQAGKKHAGMLDANERDLLYLAVKVALMEKYAERAKLPYLIDDDFSGFPPAQQALIGRVLKHVGTKAQVVHLCAGNATEAMADMRYAV